MLAAGYGTVSDIEILWTAIALCGFVFAGLNARGSWDDWKALRNIGSTNGIWYLAKAAIVTELGRAYLQLIFIYLGIYAMTLPDPPPQNNYDVWQAIARWGFTTGAMSVAGKTIYVWYVRKKLLSDPYKERKEGTR